MPAASARGIRLSPEHAAFVQGGVSVVVSARNERRVPDVLRGCGCRVSSDRTRVTVLVEPARSGSVLDDVAANGMVAVVFSQPSTHRTLQLKGADARVEPGTAADRRTAHRHLEAWAEDMRRIGYEGGFVRTVRGEGAQLARITFTIAAAFEQTPGAAAGQRIEA